jgi:hypothetical protein
MAAVMVRPVDVPPAIQATSASVPMRHFLPPLVLHRPGFSCRWAGLGKGDGTGPDIRSLLARSGEVPAGRLGARTYSHDGKPPWRERVFVNVPGAKADSALARPPEQLLLLVSRHLMHPSLTPSDSSVAPRLDPSDAAARRLARPTARDRSLRQDRGISRRRATPPLPALQPSCERTS